MASRVSPRAKRPSTARPVASTQDAEAALIQDDAAALDEPDNEQEFETSAQADVDDAEDDAPLAVARSPRRAVSNDAATAAVKRPWTDSLPRWLPAYFREALIELYKVTWPTPREAFNLTMLVVALSVAFAVVFGLIDLGLFQALSVFTSRVLAK